MKDPNAVALGKKGGEATNKKYGKEYYKKLQQLSVKARLAKKRNAENTENFES